MTLALTRLAGAQNPTDVEALKQANQNMTEAYSAKNYDKALTFARQILDLNLKIYGDDHEQTAVAYANLGKLYHLREKRREALENYEKSLAIYRKDATKNAENIASTTLNIGNLLMSDSDSKVRQNLDRAEGLYLESLAIMENKYGKESRETLPPLRSLVALYAFKGGYDEQASEKAQEFFIRYYLTSAKTNAADKDTLLSIKDDFMCFSSQSVKSPGKSTEILKKFDDALKSVKKPEEVDTDDGVVLNGKAINLAKPEYPFEARSARAGGTVLVRVTIDEKGSVVKAKAFCGNRLLRGSGENAASKSKFKPTILNGKPIAVTGILIYNFVPS